MLVRKTK